MDSILGRLSRNDLEINELDAVFINKAFYSLGRKPVNIFLSIWLVGFISA